MPNRIIPTRVGTSLCRISLQNHGEDHPHACGDKSKSPSSNNSSKGSSPRVWGQAFFISFIPPVLRIIPTRVGTRTFRVFDSSHFGDHPHACGDKTPYRISAHSRKGSSPRVWGQGYTKNLNINNGGIIPTRVGTREKIL